MPKELEQKFDILGQPLDIGCHVAVPSRNLLMICKIVKISPKMIHVEGIKKHSRSEFMVYPQHAVRIDGPDVLAYILKS